jgi:hypothetical protein
MWGRQGQGQEGEKGHHPDDRHERPGGDVGTRGWRVARLEPTCGSALLCVAAAMVAAPGHAAGGTHRRAMACMREIESARVPGLAAYHRIREPRSRGWT